MRCPYCGNIVPDYESDCHYCGQPLDYAEQPRSRDRVTQRELHNWRITEKPPSGAAVRHVPKARRDTARARNNAMRTADAVAMLDPLDRADPHKHEQPSALEKIAQIIEPGAPGELSRKGKVELNGAQHKPAQRKKAESSAAEQSDPNTASPGALQSTDAKSSAASAPKKRRDPRTAPKSAKTVKHRMQRAEHPQKQRMVSVELPPFIRTVLLAILCLAIITAAYYGVMSFINQHKSTTPSEPAMRIAMPDVYSTPEANANAAPTPLPANVMASIAASITAVPTAEPTPEPTVEPVFIGESVTVNEIMVDGDAAHELKFNVPDGQIFIEQNDCSYPVVNGKCVVTILDSRWFDAVPQADSFKVEITPVLTRANGAVEVLDTITYTALVPASPITVVKPEDGYVEVLVSLYNAQVRVQPGSTVLVDGNDVSDLIDKNGLLSINSAIEPIGENRIAFDVSTPNHKPTKLDVIVYRPIFDIPLELDINVTDSTQIDDVVISGTFMPGATLKAEPAYGTDSSIDNVNGTFRFTYKLTKIGNNTITVTASMEGKTDSVIAHDIYYMPTEYAYTMSAWAMDYTGLTDYNKVWDGRVFLCEGTVAKVVSESPQQGVIMNIGGDRYKQVYIANYSMSNLEADKEYRIYADLSGMYSSAIPSLNGRYVYIAGE